MKILFAFVLAFAVVFGQVIDPTLPVRPAPQPIPEPEPAPLPETLTLIETIIETIIAPIPEPEPVPLPEPVPVPLPEPETVPIPEPIEPPTFVCDSDECCLEFAEEEGLYSLRFVERCLDGGLHCVDQSGCEVCRRDEFTVEQEIEQIVLQQNETDFELILRPQCGGPITCETQECCDAFEGEAQLSLRAHEPCLLGGDFCYGLTGCQFCSDIPQEGLQEGELPLPPCDPIADAPCATQECCNALANPNFETGSGFLELNPLCADEETLTENCRGVSGCQLCFNPPAQGLGENLGERPLCSEGLFA